LLLKEEALALMAAVILFVLPFDKLRMAKQKDKSVQQETAPENSEGS